MKAVKRWRYYCDFCKKVSGLQGAMKKHEKGCTLNPARDCGICGFLNTGGTPLAELIALLPDPATFTVHHPAEAENFGDGFGSVDIPAHDTIDDDALREATHAVLPKLRELTENCPTCIMAALRQRGIPVPLVTDFNWTSEFKDAQSAMNDQRNHREWY